MFSPFLLILEIEHLSSWIVTESPLYIFLSHGGTPIYHPFIDGIFHYKPALGGTLPLLLNPHDIEMKTTFRATSGRRARPASMLITNDNTSSS